MKNILITGAKGQLGNELRKIFPLYPHFCFYPTDIDELDLTNKQCVENFVKTNRIDYIINCAAYTAVDKAETDRDTAYRVNRDAVKNLAEASKGKAALIHVSTDYVFDGKGNTPYKESDPVNPQSVYGESKAAGEQVLQDTNGEYIIVRTSWLYSSFGNNFVKTMIRLGRESEKLGVVADQLGSPTYAADLAKALLDIIVYSEEKGIFEKGIYHYSNEGVCSWYEFAKTIHVLADISCEVNPLTTEQFPTPAKRPQYSVMDKTKIKETFDLVIPPWQESLEKCITILKENE